MGYPKLWGEQNYFVSSDSKNNLNKNFQVREKESCIALAWNANVILFGKLLGLRKCFHCVF